MIMENIEDRNYYVYFHINTDKNEIFYVGKGKHSTNIHRYKSKQGRNRFWKDYVNVNNNWKAIKVKQNISEKYAYELEKIYIKLIGRKFNNSGTLTNIGLGGLGCGGGVSGKYHHNYGTTLKQETKDKIRETLTGTKLSEQHKQNIKIGMSKVNMKHKGGKQIININTNKIYRTIAELSLELNIPRTTLQWRLKHNRMTDYKYYE